MVCEVCRFNASYILLLQKKLSMGMAGIDSANAWYINFSYGLGRIFSWLPRVKTNATLLSYSSL